MNHSIEYIFPVYFTLCASALMKENKPALKDSLLFFHQRRE